MRSCPAGSMFRICDGESCMVEAVPSDELLALGITGVQPLSMTEDMSDALLLGFGLGMVGLCVAGNYMLCIRDLLFWSCELVERRHSSQLGDILMFRDARLLACFFVMHDI